MNDLNVCAFCLNAPARVAQANSSKTYKCCLACEKAKKFSQIRTNKYGDIVSWYFSKDVWNANIPCNGKLGAYECDAVRSFKKKNTFEMYSKELTIIDEPQYIQLDINSNVSLKDQAANIMQLRTGKLKSF